MRRLDCSSISLSILSSNCDCNRLWKRHCCHSNWIGLAWATQESKPNSRSPLWTNLLANMDNVDEEKTQTATAIIDCATPLCPPARRKRQPWILIVLTLSRSERGWSTSTLTIINNWIAKSGKEQKSKQRPTGTLWQPNWSKLGMSIGFSIRPWGDWAGDVSQPITKSRRQMELL